MSLTITQSNGGNFTPHPEGIHPAVCVDVIDLGLQKSDFNGQVKMQQKLKIVFETEEKGEDGKQLTISKNFTASLHPKAKLNAFLAKWRGKPIADGENIDLEKLVNAQCTLVISHQQNLAGKTYAAIDAVSKPTKKLKPSVNYDGVETRKRIAEWNAKQGNTAQPPVVTPAKSNAAKVAAQDEVPMGDVDPEVGF